MVLRRHCHLFALASGAFALALLAASAGPASAQLVSIGDAPLGRYELLGRFRMATFPVIIGIPGHGEELVFLHTSTWGGRIEEHGDGPINTVNSVIVATQGISDVRSVDTARGSGYSYTSAVSARVPGAFGHWSFDLSDDVWQFEAQTYWNRFIGFHLQVWSLRGFGVPDRPSEWDSDGKGEEFVRSHGGTALYRKSAFDIGIDLSVAPTYSRSVLAPAGSCSWTTRPRAS